jgi:glutamate synthase (NADPH/NADH) large chain
VGVATQNKELRALFTGQPEHVVSLFTFLATELREIMAELGFRSVSEMIGQTDRLDLRDVTKHWKYKHLDLSAILYKEPVKLDVALYKQEEQDHGIDAVLDWKLIEAAAPALENADPVYAEFPIRNLDRATGTMLSNEISKKYLGQGLPPGTVHFKFRGTAGQSFGAFGANGLRLELEGDANDYFGKGLSGAQLVLYPDRNAGYDPAKNIIIGNVAFYGATSGEAYIRGMAGERFCVRNSGVTAVVEGVGDHGCEYMTGGTAVILGETGRNFAAGMSGGVAYVYDANKTFKKRCNLEMIGFEPLEEEDKAALRNLIQNHQAHTGSTVAAGILKNWDKALLHFVKVMPKDYKAVLEKRKLSAKATAMEVANVAGEPVAVLTK